MDQSNMNIRHRRLLDMAKDHECEILYHPRKVNVVAYALNRKTTSVLIRDVCLRMVVVTLLLNLI